MADLDAYQTSTQTKKPEIKTTLQPQFIQKKMVRSKSQKNSHKDDA